MRHRFSLYIQLTFHIPIPYMEHADTALVSSSTTFQSPYKEQHSIPDSPGGDTSYGDSPGGDTKSTPSDTTIKPSELGGV